MSTFGFAPPGQMPGQAEPQHELIPVERCPLCGTALHAQQDWCLACGSAARTRLAVTPNWRMPVLALALIVLISLAVLLVALVKLA